MFGGERKSEEKYNRHDNSFRKGLKQNQNSFTKDLKQNHMSHIIRNSDNRGHSNSNPAPLDHLKELLE